MRNQKSFTPHLLEGKKERISSKPLKKGEGFTLIELMVVISIIGLISSIVLVSVKSVREKARKAAGLQFAASVHHALGAEAVGIWDFDENADNTCEGGEDVCDSSGYGNHGTINGGVAWVSDTPSGTGYALNCGGSGDYVNVGSIPISNSWTISAWFKYPLPGTSSWNTLIRGTNYHHIIVRRSDMHLGVYIGGFKDSGFNISTVSSGWHHIITTGISGNTLFYIDGQYRSTVTGFQPIDNIVAVGNYQGGGQQFGIIDDVRIYEEALSEAKIKQLYAEGAARYEVLAERE